MSRKVTGLYDDALREAGMTANQLTTLVAIERMGEVAPSVLAERLDTAKSTVSRTLKRLAQRGWVQITTRGRQQSVSLTDQGQGQILAVHERWRQAQDTAEATLGEALVRALSAQDA